jgi:hypothetical protein
MYFSSSFYYCKNKRPSIAYNIFIYSSAPWQYLEILTSNYITYYAINSEYTTYIDSSGDSQTIRNNMILHMINIVESVNHNAELLFPINWFQKLKFYYSSSFLSSFNIKINNFNMEI